MSNSVKTGMCVILEKAFVKALVLSISIVLFEKSCLKYPVGTMVLHSSKMSMSV